MAVAIVHWIYDDRIYDAALVLRAFNGGVGTGRSWWTLNEENGKSAPCVGVSSRAFKRADTCAGWHAKAIVSAPVFIRSKRRSDFKPSARTDSPKGRNTMLARTNP